MPTVRLDIGCIEAGRNYVALAIMAVIYIFWKPLQALLIHRSRFQISGFEEKIKECKVIEDPQHATNRSQSAPQNTQSVTVPGRRNSIRRRGESTTKLPTLLMAEWQ